MANRSFNGKRGQVRINGNMILALFPPFPPLESANCRSSLEHMRRCYIAILFLIVICIAFAAGATTAVMREWGSPLVFVTVENVTASPLSSVTLIYSTCGSKSSLSTQDLPPGETHTFRFLVCGEGGYGVVAVLPDGSSLVSSGGYVESGYSAFERVEKAKIWSDIKMYHL